jgi:hypothetical protein
VETAEWEGKHCSRWRDYEVIMFPDWCVTICSMCLIEYLLPTRYAQEAGRAGEVC